MLPRFLVCGEALVDRFFREQVLLRERLGGAPLNLAVGLSRLGMPSALFCGISTDTVGEKLMAFLRQEGVDTRFVERSNSRSMITIVETGVDGHPNYSFPVTDGADREISGTMLKDAIADVIALGSYLAAIPRTHHILRSLVSARGRSAVVCYDVNVRLALLPDVATWRQAFEAFLPLTHILKISDEDLHGLFGEDLDVQAKAKSFLNKGPKVVLLTRGGFGAHAYFGSTAHSAAAPTIDVVDTVGAGDSFFAGVLSTLASRGALGVRGLAELDSATLEEALVFGVAAAALTCTRDGADLPRAAEVYHFMGTHRDTKGLHL
jgi:fructokinase